VDKAAISWGGRREHPIAAEIGFAQVLDELMPGLDYWLHQDPDNTPWMLVSLDFVVNNVVRDTLRLDVDETGIRGGWSPANLNGDDGVRASDAGMDTAGPDAIHLDAGRVPVADLPVRAGSWFAHHQVSWPASSRAARWRTARG
jgi:hypothetical protein